MAHKVEDTKLERAVTLKFMASQVTGELEHKARFVRETAAAAKASSTGSGAAS